MLVTGLIMMWEGSIVSIPSGWVLCDGNNGTPDLRNKFVIGAGDSFAVDDTGGAVTHTHGFTGDGHDHTLPAGVDIQGGAGFSTTSNSAQVTGITDAQTSLPPYHALAYIMKT